MKFEKYLNEMPHTVTMQKSVVKCPQGHKIDLKSKEFAYDYAAEMTKNKQWYDLIQQNIGIYGNFKKPFPIACRKHLLVYMYDFKTGKTFAPRDDEEKKLCDLLIAGLKNKEKNPDVYDLKFTVYEGDN